MRARRAWRAALEAGALSLPRPNPFLRPGRRFDKRVTFGVGMFAYSTNPDTASASLSHFFVLKWCTRRTRSAERVPGIEARLMKRVSARFDAAARSATAAVAQEETTVTDAAIVARPTGSEIHPRLRHSRAGPSSQTESWRFS
jgi:hypothetical protein